MMNLKMTKKAAAIISLVIWCFAAIPADAYRSAARHYLDNNRSPRQIYEENRRLYDRGGRLKGRDATSHRRRSGVVNLGPSPLICPACIRYERLRRERAEGRARRERDIKAIRKHIERLKRELKERRRRR
jgi:hypothetical protein